MLGTQHRIGRSPATVRVRHADMPVRADCACPPVVALSGAAPWQWTTPC